MNCRRCKPPVSCGGTKPGGRHNFSKIDVSPSGLVFGCDLVPVAHATGSSYAALRTKVSAIGR